MMKQWFRKHRQQVVPSITWLAFIAILLLLFSGIFGVSKQSCPSSIKGNPDSNLRINYFSSPICFTCYLEAPILKKIIAEHGDRLSIQEYDVRHCKGDAASMGIIGVPGFTFMNKEDKKMIVFNGYLPEVNLRKIICDVAEIC